MFQFLKVIPIAQIVLILCFLADLCFVTVGTASDLKTQSDQKGKIAEAKRIHLKGGQAVAYTDIRVHPNANRTQTEVPIITHPLNPDIVLGSSNANPPSGNLFSQRRGFYYTMDGGTTWMGKDTLPVFPTRTNYDPTVAIDLDGNLFVGGIYRVGFTDLTELIVSKSSDNGTTWSQTIIPKSVSTAKEDKPHMIVDVNQGSPFENYVYTAFTADTAGTPIGDSPWPIMFSRSTDRGASFSTPVLISSPVTGSIGAFGANLAVGLDSELYVTWIALNAWPPAATDTVPLGFNKSTDGGATWQGAQSILSFSTVPFTTTKGGNCIRMAASFPSMAVDRSNGPRRGWIYVVYPATTVTSPDIFFIRSTDGGGTWSTPAKVNQDNSSNDQWLPWMSVDPSTGALYVVYYDSRNFPANDSAEVYISASTDGGETFADVLVSDVPFLPGAAFAGIACYMGDYIGISALNGVVWPFWNDNRTGIHQAYTSKFVFTFTPEISVSPETLDFGTVIVGNPETLAVNVQNLGYPDTLQVINISSDTSAFKPLDTTFSVPGAESQPVKVIFNPSIAGQYLGTLTIASNDTTNPNLMIPLRGTGTICTNKPGDVNGNGSYDLADIVGEVNIVFKGAPKHTPACRDDANADGVSTLPDIVKLVNKVFKGGPTPPPIGVCCK